MNGAVTVFKNQEFGQIRSLMIEGEPWFVGKDVAQALGYSNTADAVKKHVVGEDKQHFNLRNLQTLKMYNYGATIINESGLYSLILSSKLPAAQKFKRWVTNEVLPAIRKTGSYSVNQNQKPQSNLEQTLANALLAAQHIISYRDQQLAELQGLIPEGSQPVQIKEPEQLVQIQELEPPKEPDPPKQPEPPEPAAEAKRTYRQRSILATCTQICVKEQILDIAAMNVARQLHCSQNEAIGLIVRYWMWNVKVMDSNGNVPHTSREEVADVLIRGKCDAYTAEEAVDALISTKLISKENGMLQAADWMRWQGMITNAEKLRVQNNRRQREYRRRQKDKNTMEA